MGEPLTGHTDCVESVAFSPDGKRIVSGSIDKTIRIWDVATGKQIGEPLIGHTYTVLSVAFSPDGKRIVSGSSDNTIRIWDFPSLQDLIDITRQRFKERQLTPEEKREYYLE
ncbi:MAG: PD40 domain-containing protein [Bacteroidaceae bacterium]|nr:PD40 domain-containing protein [Bacteroidaceae bacterium]